MPHKHASLGTGTLAVHAPKGKWTFGGETPPRRMIRRQLLGRSSRLDNAVAEIRRDVVHEAVHLLAHIGVGAVAEVEVENDLVDADFLDPLQGVDNLLGRSVKQRVVVEVGSFGVIEALADFLEVLHGRRQYTRTA